MEKYSLYKNKEIPLHINLHSQGFHNCAKQTCVDSFRLSDTYKVML